MCSRILLGVSLNLHVLGTQLYIMALLLRLQALKSLRSRFEPLLHF